jgi:hypothetical protein
LAGVDCQVDGVKHLLTAGMDASTVVSTTRGHVQVVVGRRSGKEKRKRRRASRMDVLRCIWLPFEIKSGTTECLVNAGADPPLRVAMGLLYISP